MKTNHKTKTNYVHTSYPVFSCLENGAMELEAIYYYEIGATSHIVRAQLELETENSNRLSTGDAPLPTKTWRYQPVDLLKWH